jgi:hypothetical protein
MFRRAWLVLLCLITSSLVATATVCAQESFAGAGISCGGAVHAEGDADQVRDDAHKGIPHHHGSCHGHAFAVNALPAALPLPPLASARPEPRPKANASLRAFGPALRPPRG